MIRAAVILKALPLAAAGAAGWFAAPFWQAQPSLRSAVRLLFRAAAGGNADGALSLNGNTVSPADLRDAAALRAMLTRIRDAAATASPQDAEHFLAGLMEQLAVLPPADLRSLALALARDRDLLLLMDETTKAVGLRLLSKDLEMRLFLTLAKVVRRDPDRMLLLAEALPPSRTRDEFLSRTLALLGMDRPAELMALMNGPDAPLKGRARLLAVKPALSTLAARSFPDAVAAWENLQDPEVKWDAVSALSDRINDEPDRVFDWLDRLPERERNRLTSEALRHATPEVARRWLEAHPVPEAGDMGFLQACGRLAKTDPAGAVAWLAKIPAGADSRPWRIMVPDALRDMPVSGLLAVIPGMPPENQELFLPGMFSGKNRTAEELSQAAAAVSDPSLQEKLGTAWAGGRWEDTAAAMAQATALPPGPLRDSALTELGRMWSYSSPDEWLAWLRTAPPEDQTAAMAKAEPQIWADPKNAAFLTVRPAAEQLPWLAGIYHDNAQAAAAVIERASAQGAGNEALDSAAKSLAQSWQDRDPATARAFALSLPDPAMADSVLLSLAANSATAEARAAAIEAIQDPVNRQQAGRGAALKSLGISAPR
ncbi:MAG: hypothetical protein V4726_05915 [Verrucomicrobiota bacterium]